MVEGTCIQSFSNELLRPFGIGGIFHESHPALQLATPFLLGVRRGRKKDLVAAVVAIGIIVSGLSERSRMFGSSENSLWPGYGLGLEIALPNIPRYLDLSAIITTVDDKPASDRAFPLVAGSPP